MKTLRRFFGLVLVLVLTTVLAVPAYAVLYDPNHLYYLISSMKSESGKDTPVRDIDLDKIAGEYAEILFKDREFRRTTDFKTLPNGERVISLAQKSGITVTGFNYSVFCGSAAEEIAGTNEFKEKVNGDYHYVGIARIDDYDDNGFGVVIVVIVYAKTVYENIL